MRGIRDFTSREINRHWLNFISNERALQKSYKDRIHNKIEILTAEVRLRNVPFFQEKQTPFHLAAERGYLPLCQQIMERSDDKNPKDNLSVTPLHSAAKNGHLSVCQLIIKNVDDKNPKDNRGWTPLHRAAWNGHLLVCPLIVKEILMKKIQRFF